MLEVKTNNAFVFWYDRSGRIHWNCQHVVIVLRKQPSATKTAQKATNRQSKDIHMKQDLLSFQICHCALVLSGGEQTNISKLPHCTGKKNTDRPIKSHYSKEKKKGSEHSQPMKKRLR